MLTIVEGPDGGGKSMLVEKMNRALAGKGEFVSMLGGRTMTGEEMRRRTWEVLNRRGVDVLCERFHAISDEVYRGAFGGPRAFSRQEYETVCTELAKVGCRIVYCRPPVEVVIAQGLTAKGDDTAEWLTEVTRKLRFLYEYYDEVVNVLAWRHSIPVVRYDYAADVVFKREMEAMLCAG